MTPPTPDKLDAMLEAIEEHLHPEEAVIAIIGTPKDGGGIHLTLSMNCDEAAVKLVLAELLRRYDEKTLIGAQSAH